VREAQDGCQCICHRRPGVRHFLPCCGPGSFRSRQKELPNVAVEGSRSDQVIQNMKTRDIEKGFHPAETHAELLGLSDRDLRLRAGDATHQHYKGGLYRMVGKARDADTGEPLLGKDGQPRILYEHCYPHKREFWVRDASDFAGRVDFNGEINALERFRALS
jgi:hypothetical protein